MNKFVKFVLICGSALFLGGLLLALASLALGGDLYIVQERLNQMGVVHIGDRYHNREPVYSREHSVYDKDFTFPATPEEPPAPPVPGLPGALDTEDDGEALAQTGEYEIKQLDFSFDVGEVYIILGDDFELIYGNDNTRRYFYEKHSGDTWIIGSNKIRWSWPWNYRRNDVKLTVVLPRDFVAERATISMGAGNMQTGQIVAKELVLDVAVGNCQISNLSAAEAKLSVGVGNLEIASFHAAKAWLDAGMGNVQLTLNKPLEQYRCHLDVGLGTVRLGGNTYSGVAEVEAGPAEAPYNFDISCGLGSISVQAPLTVQI